MKMKMLALALLAGGSMFAQTRFSFGINVGGYRPGYYQSAPPYAVQVPVSPGPGYVWVDGYWTQYGGRNIWVAGSWARRPYATGYYQAPRYYNRGYEGYERRGYRRDEDEEREHGRGYGYGFRDR